VGAAAGHNACKDDTTSSAGGDGAMAGGAPARDGMSEPPGYVRPSAYTTPKGPDARAQQITVNVLSRMRESRAGA